jgi:hypothetical protein
MGRFDCYCGNYSVLANKYSDLEENLTTPCPRPILTTCRAGSRLKTPASFVYGVRVQILTVEKLRDRSFIEKGGSYDTLYPSWEPRLGGLNCKAKLEGCQLASVDYVLRTFLWSYFSPNWERRDFVWLGWHRILWPNNHAWVVCVR